MASLFSLVCLFVSLPFSSAQLDTLSCPLLGPAFPAPVNPSGSRAVGEAQQFTRRVIQWALSNNRTSDGLDSNSTSFSLQLYSLHEVDPLFTYHFRAPALAKPSLGVATVDSNTIYRIGSISKVWTVYLYLITAGDTSFNDPITKYVPELAQYADAHDNEIETDDIDTVNWKDITVGSLASHLSGIGRDTKPLPANDQFYSSLGLPPVRSSNVSLCGGNQTLQLPCDRTGMTFSTLPETKLIYSQHFLMLSYPGILQ